MFEYYGKGYINGYERQYNIIGKGVFMYYLWMAVGFIMFISVNTMAVEERPYTVMDKDDAIEIRDYTRVITADVVTTGERGEAATKAFRILVEFIKGSNDTNLQIPMTAPVSQTAIDENQWNVSFYMPSDMSKNRMPRPVDNRITITEVKGAQMAVIRFSGTAHQENLDRHERQLRDFLKTNKYDIVDKVIYAFYNPPYIPWFLRRNEILIEVKL